MTVVDRTVYSPIVTGCAGSRCIWLRVVNAVFLQSYVLEGALAELQERTARFTQAFSGGSLGLLLNPTKLVRSKKTTVDSIEKIALVRTANGSVEHWTLQQLSGGERRRVVSHVPALVPLIAKCTTCVNHHKPFFFLTGPGSGAGICRACCRERRPAL